MKIGFFSPTISQIGGGEWITLNMINALKTTEHKTIVYSAKKINHAHIQNFLGQSLNFDEVTIRPNIFDPSTLENIYPNVLKSFLFNLKCNLLIDTFSNAVFPWADAVYFHGRAKITQLPKGIKGVLLAPYKIFLKNSIKHTKPEEKILMTCSKNTAKAIEASIGLPVNVLYPPVSDLFKIRNEISSKTNTVVTVTRISNDKRPETILQIAKLTPNNISFTIIGSCRSTNELKALNKLQEFIQTLRIKERVKLLVNVSRETQIEILQKSKVYLHPFVPYEALGISVIEAMSAGCIPIAPCIGGLKEIVPTQYRYTSLEGAASLIEDLIASWSPSKAQKSAKIADKFSYAKFREEFLKIMRL